MKKKKRNLLSRGIAQNPAQQEMAAPSYEGDDTYELVVCHGNVIRYFVCRALQFPPEAWIHFATYNCGLTHIAIRSSGVVSLLGFGDIGHLNLEQVTYH